MGLEDEDGVEGERDHADEMDEREQPIGPRLPACCGRLLHSPRAASAEEVAKWVAGIAPRRATRCSCTTEQCAQEVGHGAICVARWEPWQPFKARELLLA